MSRFGGDLPRTEDPVPPARIGDQQGSAAILSGGVDVQGPATIAFEGGSELVGTSLIYGVKTRLDLGSPGPSVAGSTALSGGLDALVHGGCADDASVGCGQGGAFDGRSWMA